MDLQIHKIHRPPIHFPAKCKISFVNARSQARCSMKFPLQSSFSLNHSSRFQISAHFGQHPTIRHNYIRKKLNQIQQVSDLWDNSNLKLADLDSDADSEESSDILEIKSIGDSVMLIDLKSLDEKYQNPEFWGKGKGIEPIFTVSGLDNGGKLKRVVLNEEELLRRSGVDPLLYKEGFVKGLAQLNSRILVASMFARQIEKRKLVFSFSSRSSVVKLFSTTTTTKDLPIINPKKAFVVDYLSLVSITMIMQMGFIFWLGSIPIILIDFMLGEFRLWFIKKPSNLWSNYRQRMAILFKKWFGVPVNSGKTDVVREITGGIKDDQMVKGRESIQQPPTLVCKATSDHTEEVSSAITPPSIGIGIADDDDSQSDYI